MSHYQLVSKGINPRADKAQVEEKFAQLFKLTPEKSAALLSKPQVVLRCNLDEPTAHAYCDKLKRIGVNATVVKNVPLPSLAQEKVDFIELDVDVSREKETISRVMDIPGYPIVYVGYKRLVNGMDVAEIKNSL